jgi:hypothetical protein
MVIDNSFGKDKKKNVNFYGENLCVSEGYRNKGINKQFFLIQHFLFARSHINITIT